jgi:periplasmic protein TonB
MNNDVIRKEWVGLVVDARFRLLQWVGNSGRSGVFVCEIDGDPGRKGAIKLFPAVEEDADSCAAGWAAAAELSYPHLIRVFSTGRTQVETTDVLYVVTEYAGEVLAEVLPDRALTPAEVREMLGPILSVLTYLHERGFAHRRLKPSNILVVNDQLKVSSENIHFVTTSGAPPRPLDIYDAPERAQGKTLPASDIWSLGITLVEALTRVPPKWDRSKKTEPVVPSSVPQPFFLIAQECLRFDPEVRCTLREIRDCLEKGTSIPHRLSQHAETPARGKSKLVVAVSAVAILVALAIVLLHSHNSESSAIDQAPPTTSSPTENPSTPAPSPSSAIPPAATTPPQEATPQQSQAPAAQPEATTPQPSQTAPAPESSSASNEPPASAPEKPAEEPAPTIPAPRLTGGPFAKGAVAQQVMPDVPAKALRTVHGTVKLSIKVDVDPNGTVSDASIDSQGASKYFAERALKAAQFWKFTPAQSNGQAVASEWLLHFRFRQSGIEVTPIEQRP